LHSETDLDRAAAAASQRVCRQNITPRRLVAGYNGDYHAGLALLDQPDQPIDCRYTYNSNSQQTYTTRKITATQN